jgi:hypothetical protein
VVSQSETRTADRPTRVGRSCESGTGRRHTAGGLFASSRVGARLAQGPAYDGGLASVLDEAVAESLVPARVSGPSPHGADVSVKPRRCRSRTGLLRQPGER